MKTHYVCYMESLEGDEGSYYCEVANGEIIRQVCCFGANYYWSTLHECKNERYDFTDNSIFRGPKKGDTPISSEEFDRIWRIALDE